MNRPALLVLAAVLTLGGRFHSPALATTRAPASPHDLVLDDEGRLSGQIVDPGGHAVAGVSITLVQRDGRRWAATTDTNGRFAIAGLTTGAYFLASSDAELGQNVRLWRADLAPPKAQRSLLLVRSARVTRGQYGGEGGFFTGPLAHTLIVATSIATPLALADGS